MHPGKAVDGTPPEDFREHCLATKSLKRPEKFKAKFKEFFSSQILGSLTP